MAVLGDISRCSARNFSSSSLQVETSKERRGNPHCLSPSSPFLRLSAESWTPASSKLAIRPLSKQHAQSSRVLGRRSHCRQVLGLGLGLGIHGRYAAHLGSFHGSRVCNWSKTGGFEMLLPLSPGALKRHINQFPSKNSMKRHGAHTVVACNPDDGASTEAFESLAEKNGHFGLSANDKDSPAIPTGSSLQINVSENEEDKAVSLEHLKGLLQSALEELHLARLNSSKIEEDAQSITERAIALQDEATDAEAKAENAAAMVNKICNEELGIEELLSKGRSLFAEAEAHVLLAEKALNQAKEALVDQQWIVAEEGVDSVVEYPSTESNVVVNSSTSIETSKDSDNVENTSGQAVDETLALPKEEEELAAAQAELKAYGLALAQYEDELIRVKNLKVELQKEALHLAEAAKVARAIAVEADEEVTQVMSLAEQAVAVEMEAAQKVCIAEMALQKFPSGAAQSDPTLAGTLGAESVCVPADELQRESPAEVDKIVAREIVDNIISHEAQISEKGLDLEQVLPVSASLEAADVIDDAGKKIFETLKVEAGALQEIDAEKLKTAQQLKKENAKEATPAAVPKSSTKRSSRFFSASYFSFNDDEEEFTPTTIFQGIKQHFLKVSIGVLLLCGG